MAPQLAVIGLGKMGSGISKNIVEKADLGGKSLILFNRTQKRARDLNLTLPAGKSQVAGSLVEVVSRADIIFTCLENDHVVKEVIASALKENVEGKLFVDCSTIHPDTTKRIAEDLHKCGAEMVACPVFGPPSAAEAGQLVCVLAGPASAVQRVAPYCQGVMGKANIVYSDEAQDKASMLKIIGNIFLLNLLEALSDGHTLAEKSGLGSEKMHQFFTVMYPGPYAGYSKSMVNGDYHKREKPLFGVDLARKDVGHALDLAISCDVSLKSIERADGHLEVVKDHKGPSGDVAAIYGAVRLEAGMGFEN